MNDKIRWLYKYLLNKKPYTDQWERISNFKTIIYDLKIKTTWERYK